MTGGIVPLLLLGLIITLALIVAGLIDIVLRMKHELTQVHEEAHDLAFMLVAHLRGEKIPLPKIRTDDKE